MRYEIHVRRDDGWWVVRIPAIDGVTQARRLEDIAAEARDFIVLDQDVAPSSVEIDITSIVVCDHEFVAAIRDVTTTREAAKAAEADAMAKTRDLARALADAKVPVRDIGEALGLSHQRAHQLVSGSPSVASVDPQR